MSSQRRRQRRRQLSDGVVCGILLAGFLLHLNEAALGVAVAYIFTSAIFAAAWDRLRG